MKLTPLLALAVVADLNDRLGFDPGMVLTLPPGTAEAVGRYLNSEVLTEFVGQVKNNPPVRLHPPGTLVPASKKELLESFEMAYMSFCPAKRVVDFECICSTDYTDVTDINDRVSQSTVIIAVFPKKRTISVSYAFTHSARNWLTNIDAAAIQLPNAPKGVKVHFGFYTHYMSTHNETMAVVTNLVETKYKDFDILAAGYSLGASIAILSAPAWYEFKKTHNNTVRILSYSGARVGNLASKLYFESLGIPITRYTNQDDIVTMLPPRSLDYVHTGVEVYEYATQTHNKTAFVTCSQEYDEDPDCQWRERYHPTISRHLFPFNSFVPLPPYCNRKDYSDFK
ncbi:hypothetical protein DSO57_1012638 [Entomophthora muscae]|uniref:Uncharacterized protein n=1 Tax=Entomophthora muscae TaxID=34485 RepID=A0ACC2S7P9_9FUNG|nr:hypothetical protein DSO57_1012638 [Entomophthora muscae]